MERGKPVGSRLLFVFLLLNCMVFGQIKEEEGTALTDAANNGEISEVCALLDKGIDVNTKNINGATPLMGASFHGHSGVVRLLLDRGASVNEKAQGGSTALMAACQEGHDEIVDMLLDNGAEVNAKTSDGETALHYACHGGNTNTVNSLLDKGADVNVSRDDGVTPLYMASHLGNIDIVKALLDKGADVNAETEDGTTAGMVAFDQGHREVVQLFRDQGIRIDQIVPPNKKLTLKAHNMLIGYGVEIQPRYGEGFVIAIASDDPRRKQLPDILVSNSVEGTAVSVLTHEAVDKIKRSFIVPRNVLSHDSGEVEILYSEDDSLRIGFIPEQCLSYKEHTKERPSFFEGIVESISEVFSSSKASPGFSDKTPYYIAFQDENQNTMINYVDQKTVRTILDMFPEHSIPKKLLPKE